MNTDHKRLEELKKSAQPERRVIPCPDGKPGCCVLHYSSDLFDTPEKQNIRWLIQELENAWDRSKRYEEALKRVVALGPGENIPGTMYKKFVCNSSYSHCREALEYEDAK